MDAYLSGQKANGLHVAASYVVYMGLEEAILCHNLGDFWPDIKATCYTTLHFRILVPEASQHWMNGASGMAFSLHSTTEHANRDTVSHILLGFVEPEFCNIIDKL